MIAILGSGIAMTAVRWGDQGWLVAAFIGLVAMGALGGLVSRQVRSLRATLASGAGTELSDAFRSARSVQAPGASVRLRLTIGVGVLALMSFRPGAAGSALILAAAVLAGLVAGLSPNAKRPTPAEPIGS
jgi:hypothetical protein